MLLLIDNYDSFVHNLARYFQRLGRDTLVLRNDAVTVPQVTALAPEAIVLSPGPGTPSQAGRSLELVREFAGRMPMLGICLGHQILAAAYGAHVVRAREPVHGRSSQIQHVGTGVFAGLPSPMRVGRYHSLVVQAETLPSPLRPLAHTHDGTLMALEHREHPMVGLQFHPESVLTDHGYELLAAFLRQVGLDHRQPLPTDESLAGPTQPASESWPSQPISF
jgi:anthranilate synthase/aminodeoxychorismate synthase-like glutamine amidotransferase